VKTALLIQSIGNLTGNTSPEARRAVRSGKVYTQLHTHQTWMISGSCILVVFLKIIYITVRKVGYVSL